MDFGGKKLFKKSLVGGFSKQDVSEYIESLISQHNAKLQELKDELNKAMTEKIALTDELNAERVKNAELTEKNNELLKEIEQNKAQNGEADRIAAERDELRESLAEKNRELDKIRKDFDSANGRLKELEALESQYRENKERIAEIELSALARASQREQEAGERVKMLEESAKQRVEEQLSEVYKYRDDAFNQVEELLKSTHSSYISLKSEIDALTTHIARMVETAQSSTARVSTACERAGSILEGMRNKNITLKNDKNSFTETGEERL
ncbi:MAG: hypothetical protein GX541_04385 [Clostridiales bacterium]|jgi:chromosome segregation ATPase|nr:hypothetical protein [Clostridiales bacterium]